MLQITKNDQKYEYGVISGLENFTDKSTYLKDAFKVIPEINQPITENIIKALVEFVISFETRGEHPLALNTHLLGAYPIYFTDTDRQVFFAIIGNVKENTIQRIMKGFSGTGDEWVVLNDPFNQMVVYTAYRINNSSLDENLKYQGLLAVFKLMHYSFFTSLMFHYFRYGANKDVMEATIRSLSSKFDIVKHGTWKKVIEERSKLVFIETSIHYNTLKTFEYDKQVLYVITDIQSRIRSKVKLINQIFREKKESGDAISSYGVVDNIDDQKIITASTNILDNILSGMNQEIQASGRFIDNELIRILSIKFKAINEAMLRRVLTMYSDVAVLQYSSGDFNTIGAILDPYSEDYDEIEGYIGLGILTREFLQKSYRHCMVNKVDMTSKGAILLKVINLYSASRITDADILLIKKSFTNFILNCGESVRAITVSSLTLALISYLLIRSFDYME